MKTWALALGFAWLTSATGCFVSNPTAATDAGASAPASLDASEIDSAASDGASDAAREGAVDAGPSACVRYGGYGTVEKVVGDLFAALVADCRVSRYFTVLDAGRQGHLYDCLVKQVAVLMGCPGIRYDVDNAGVECRDMRASHKGLAIRGEDFDALVEDLVGVLQKNGVSQADIDALAPKVLSLRADIVENSAPGYGKLVCDAGADS